MELTSMESDQSKDTQNTLALVHQQRETSPLPIFTRTQLVYGRKLCSTDTSSSAQLIQLTKKENKRRIKSTEQINVCWISSQPRQIHIFDGCTFHSTSRTTTKYNHLVKVLF